MGFGKVIIVCGSPAVGKTTYARKLAKELTAVILDLDICTERLVQTGLIESQHNPDDRDSEYYKQTYREQAYETLFDIAKDNLARLTAIIVGPFTREIRDPNWIKNLSLRLEAQVEVHYLYCQPEVRKERMLRRGNPRDTQKINDWDKINQYYGEESAPVFEHVFVDTSASRP